MGVIKLRNSSFTDTDIQCVPLAVSSDSGRFLSFIDLGLATALGLDQKSGALFARINRQADSAKSAGILDRESPRNAAGKSLRSTMMRAYRAPRGAMIAPALIRL